jgi:hypothetical protein
MNTRSVEASASPRCYLCNVQVDAAHYCHGCQQHICDACDDLSGPMGAHEPRDHKSYPRRLVTAPMGVMQQKNVKPHLVHAVEVDPQNNVLRVLCGSAKPEHILGDPTTFNQRAITCEQCYRRRDCREIRDGVPS